jgi:non-heme chloroperoxidase
MISLLYWSKQIESTLKDDARTVALDRRGHGMSDALTQVDQYTDGNKWADDIEAVIDELSGRCRDECTARRPRTTIRR